MIAIGIAIPLTELQANLSPQPPLTNMLGWWKKNTAAGASWPDAIQGEDITLTGSPTIAGGVVTFNGTSQYGATTGENLNFTAAFTLYMRVKQVSWTITDCLLDNDSTGGSFDVTQTTATPGVVLNTHATPSAVDNDLTVGAFKSLSCGSLSGATDGFIQVSGGTELLTGVNPNGGTRLFVAASGAAALFANIAVAEIILYNVEHTPAERLATFAYLNTL